MSSLGLCNSGIQREVESQGAAAGKMLWGAESSPCFRATEGVPRGQYEDSLTCAPPPSPGNPPRPSPEPEEPRRPTTTAAATERGSGSGTPKLIQRALLRGTALLASLGLGRDLQPPGVPGRERGEPPPTPPAPLPTRSPAEPPPSPLIRFSPKTPDAPASPLSPDAPGPPTPVPLLLELGVPSGQPSAKSPRREEERRGEWRIAGRLGGGEGRGPGGGKPTGICWAPNQAAGHV